MVIERQDMATKEKFDGRSRPTNKVYEKRWDEIFGQKEIKKLNESLKQSKANRKERELDKETQDYVDSLKDKL